MNRINVERFLKSDGTDADIAVNATANVWTRSKKIATGSQFCVSIRAKSDLGTPDLDIYLEQTHLDPSLTSEGNAQATGEGVIGDIYNGWKVPEGSSKLLDITDKVWHHLAVSPVALPFMRLLIDGQGVSPADTTVEVRISQQDNYAS